jgi:hypothetical protein
MEHDYEGCAEQMSKLTEEIQRLSHNLGVAKEDA